MALIKKPITLENANSAEVSFSQFLTPSALQHIQKQLSLCKNVVVNTDEDGTYPVTSSECCIGGTLTFLTDSYLGCLIVTSSSCHSKFANTINLPCHHIFAVCSKAGLPLFSTGDVSNRWSICYLKEVFEKKCSCEESVSDELY